MLIQRCALEQNRLIVPVSVTRPVLASGQFQTEFSHHQYRALVDTGAQRSVVAHSIIAQQRLMRTGHMEFASLHGPQTHTRYLAGIALWVQRIDRAFARNSHSDLELSLYAIENPFEVVDMKDNVNFDMILGFDVLKAFSFSYSTADRHLEICVQP